MKYFSLFTFLVVSSLAHAALTIRDSVDSLEKTMNAVKGGKLTSSTQKDYLKSQIQTVLSSKESGADFQMTQQTVLTHSIVMSFFDKTFESQARIPEQVTSLMKTPKTDLAAIQETRHIVSLHDNMSDKQFFDFVNYYTKFYEAYMTNPSTAIFQNFRCRYLIGIRNIDLLAKCWTSANAVTAKSSIYEDYLLNQAQSYVQVFLLDTAIKLYNDLIPKATSPNNIAAYRMALARAYAFNNNIPMAKTELAKVPAAAIDGKLKKGLDLINAEIAVLENKMPEAKKMIATVSEIKGTPRQLDATLINYRIGAVLLATGDTKKAFELYKANALNKHFNFLMEASGIVATAALAKNLNESIPQPIIDKYQTLDKKFRELGTSDQTIWNVMAIGDLIVNNTPLTAETKPKLAQAIAKLEATAASKGFVAKAVKMVKTN